MLVLAWQCRRWGALPAAGGLLEQPLAIMVQMEAALNTFEAFAARERADNAVEFSKRYPHLVQFCQWVEQLNDD
jgi:hypothetical protein